LNWRSAPPLLRPLTVINRVCRVRWRLCAHALGSVLIARAAGFRLGSVIEARRAIPLDQYRSFPTAARSPSLRRRKTRTTRSSSSVFRLRCGRSSTPSPSAQGSPRARADGAFDGWPRDLFDRRLRSLRSPSAVRSATPPTSPACGGAGIELKLPQRCWPQTPPFGTIDLHLVVRSPARSPKNRGTICPLETVPEAAATATLWPKP